MNKDALPRPQLTERQLRILSTLIRTYTQRPEPVSSKQLVDDNELGVSSATVRNELAVLEQLGMIRAPHTSAGRVPTEEGYRYFVQQMMHGQDDLTANEQQLIKVDFEQSAQDLHKLVRAAASILARQTSAAALITEPRSRAVRFKHLQLINTQGRMVLMVMVLDGGDLLQQMLSLAEPAEQERLTQISTMINATCSGETAENIRQKSRTSGDVLTQEVLELVADVLSEAGSSREYSIYSYGLSDILPEFGENVGAQQALRVLEGSKVISQVFTETIEGDNPMRVIVGGDNRYEFEEISHLGIVIGRYGTRHLSGAISVLGPTRMRYGRAISTVRYVSTLISAMLKDFYGEEE